MTPSTTASGRPYAVLLLAVLLPAVAVSGAAIAIAVSGSEPGGKVTSAATPASVERPLPAAGIGSDTRSEIQATPPAQTEPSTMTAPPVPPTERKSSDADGNRDVYIALGDSLAAGVGASSFDLGYVGVFHHRLELIEGRPISLLNLGVSGATSAEILADQLPGALQEIQRLRDDGDPTTSVSVVTLNAGGNDLRGALALWACLSDLFGETCLTGLNVIADELRDNLEPIIDLLLDGPGEVPTVYLMNLYSLSDERLESFQRVLDLVTAMLNEAIVDAGDRAGVIVVDVSSIFRGRAEELTNVATADIHPNDAGHRELAGALLRAAGNQQPPEG